MLQSAAAVDRGVKAIPGVYHKLKIIKFWFQTSIKGEVVRRAISAHIKQIFSYDRASASALRIHKSTFCQGCSAGAFQPMLAASQAYFKPSCT